jgi:hypothetical protein
MATLDGDRIWRALGSFFDLFPEDERVYWKVFWESFGDVTADLWGYALQVDRSKSIFATTATFERRNVLVKLSDLQQGASFFFDLVSVTTSPEGAVFVRGFIPREKRTFKTTDLPAQGYIRIGVDVLKYVAVNTIAIVGGVFDGFVREATFTLASQTLPHDYSDSIDINEPFYLEPIDLAFRVNQSPGANFIDATSNGQVLELNSTGKISFGEVGFNAESFEYQSLAVIGDRYVFTLPSTYRAPVSSAPVLQFPHLLGEPIRVLRYTPSKWTQAVIGPARIYADNAVVMMVDNLPAPAVSSAELTSQLLLQENTDIDISVSTDIDVWGALATNSTSKKFGARLRIGTQTYFAGFRSNRSLVGVTTHEIIAGPESSLVSKPISTPPDQVEWRFTRTGSTLEISYKEPLDGDFILLATVVVTGERSVLSLIISDTNTNSPSQVRFDEVVRRLGGVVGSSRLEDDFNVTGLFPFSYSGDVSVVSGSSMRDYPRLHEEAMAVIDDIEDGDQITIRAMGSGDTFSADGVPSSGVMVFDTVSMIYDGVTRSGSIFEFQIRGKLDPNLLPLTAGRAFIVRTREIQTGEFVFDGAGGVSFRDLPTRDRMWIPIAQVDERHVQKLYGPLVDITTDVSTEAYVRRVQGAWFALFGGPSIENIHIGIHLAMGLPVAKEAGVVQRIFERVDVLGRVIERSMVIVNQNGSTTYHIPPEQPRITWLFGVGARVDRFAPLTAGVEVLDFQTDPNWHLRFRDVADAERFNTFGVFIDTNVLTEDSSLADAIRFALRIKPNSAKLVMHFLLTAGNEVLQVEDDGFFATIASMCEDVSFDEGSPPLPPQTPLRMGDGHKMGQGKFMGSNSIFRVFPVLGIGLHMGTGLTMGMDPRAYVCDPNEDNHATESITSTAIVEVDGGS